MIISMRRMAAGAQSGRVLLGFILAFALLLAAPFASADQRIANFVSDATISTDASVTVRETIAYEFRNEGQKRGIFRDFPTRYRDDSGFNFNVGFEVLSVKRDGQDEPYSIESISNGKRIKIGKADIFLEEGQHIYEITYRTTRQLGFFDGFDEFYWNVTGSAWQFPITRAEAIVRLPPGAKIIQHQAYTGPDGSKGRDFHVLQGDGNVYRAETTQPVFVGNNFTIAVGFTKGIITPPTESEKRAWFFSDNAGIIALVIGVLGIAGYYLYAWMKVGRDPPGGPIVPLFSPPPALGPAGSRFVWRQSFDDKAFASAMVGLAVKKRLKIYDQDKGYAVEKLNQAGPALTASESAVYNAMASGRQELKQSNYVNVRAMRSALQNALNKEFDGVAFLRNTGWFVRGLLLSIALLILTAFIFVPTEDAVIGVIVIIWTAVWWGGTFGILLVVLKAFSHRGFFSKLGSLFGFAFLVPFAIAGLIGPLVVYFGGESLVLSALVTAAIIIGVLNIVFLRLLRAPTIAGRKLLDQIEGFRMYLITAEEDRLNVLNPPEKTPELFERYLPYALALNCENEWSEKFAAILTAAGVAAPAWYAGNNWNTSNMGGFTNSIGSSFASTTSSSYSPPGSSSGSSSSSWGGGGGSSGGGGGGGGGGSW